MENIKFTELSEDNLLEIDGGVAATTVIGLIVVGGFVLGGVRGCAAEDKKNGYK